MPARSMDGIGSIAKASERLPDSPRRRRCMMRKRFI